jgi:nitrate reductase gamma subunit
MIESWIDLARGPLFRISLGILVLGLAYRFGVVLVQVVAAWRRAGDRRLPTGAVAAATLGWLLPKRLLRARPLYSVASFSFHVGIILVPLFLVGHVALLRGYLPRDWPRLDPLLADVLTLVCVVALGSLLIGRTMSPTARALSKTQDVAIVAMLLLLVLSGFFASHPMLSPLGARTMLLVHMLVGNLALVLTPMTKIVHCVLYPLTQLVFELGWHFPAETGEHVAVALNKEGEPV